MTSLNDWIDKKLKDDNLSCFEYGEFSNQEEVAEGGYAVVKSADWESRGIKVALKFFKNNLSIDKEHMEVFFKELKLLSQVGQHQNINEFFGIAKEPSTNNYVMILKYANQSNLREHLKNKFVSLQWRDKINMALDIARGLDYLHFRGIIHRDLHSKNILVHDSRLMIADFGLSKQLAAGLPDASNSINNRGMIPYVEPKCFKDPRYRRDKKSDIYSLGVLLWEISIGRPPFSTRPIQPQFDYSLPIEILSDGLREQPATDTPSTYKDLYEECWDGDPSTRPNIVNVFNRLKREYEFIKYVEQQDQIKQKLNNKIKQLELNNIAHMYYGKTDTPALCRISSLVGELGQIEYIFSDKTGTLTCNEMEFRQCSIAGIAYADAVEESKRARVIDGVEVGLHCFKELKSNLRNHSTANVINEFLILLAVCHTVTPERIGKNSNDIIYRASSPDEGALVKGASVLDYKFTTRRPRSVTIVVNGREQEYEILNICEFNSTRKRMSTVVRSPDGRIKLYCKGADTVILERLSENNPFTEQTLQHLEEYADEGLRTLCISVREISEEEYGVWAGVYEKASTTLTNRREGLDKAAEMIEKDLFLLGATAIEDKLRERNPKNQYS